jgi:hypothetical protein
MDEFRTHTHTLKKENKCLLDMSNRTVDRRKRKERS